MAAPPRISMVTAGGCGGGAGNGGAWGPRAGGEYGRGGSGSAFASASLPRSGALPLVGSVCPPGAISGVPPPGALGPWSPLLPPHSRLAGAPGPPCLTAVPPAPTRPVPGPEEAPCPTPGLPAGARRGSILWPLGVRRAGPVGLGRRQGDALRRDALGTASWPPLLGQDRAGLGSAFGLQDFYLKKREPEHVPRVSAREEEEAPRLCTGSWSSSEDRAGVGWT